MKRVTNTQAFAQYRQLLPTLLNGRDHGFFAQILDDDMRILMTVGVWAARYSARGSAIAGPLADTTAAAALIARNRARDVTEPMAQGWPPSLLQQIAQTMGVTRTGGEAMDVSAATDAHGFGPSLRALWAQAERVGFDDAEAWAHVRDWAIRRPTLAKPPAATTALADRLGRAARWSKTGDLDHPWTGNVAGEVWRIRLNDFPEDCLYGLEVDGAGLGDFNDWPQAWQREEEASRPAPKRIVAAPALTGAAAERWLSRYQAGEHEAVWAEMTALGGDVRQPPHLDHAWAVARESMRRARHNVELIISRLDGIGYQFWNGERGTLAPQRLKMWLGGRTIEYPSPEAAARDALSIDPSITPTAGMRHHVEQAKQRLASLLGPFMEQQRLAAEHQEQRLKKQAEITDHREDGGVFSPPTKGEIAFIRKLEKKGMFLPLSLRAWAEQVGDVTLAGAHPALCFWEDADFPGVHADPLMVTLDHFMFFIEGWVESCDAGEDPGVIDPVLGWDAEAKARLAVADEQLDYGYTMEMPNAAADAPLAGEPHNTGFVDYLRIAFRWGGFPGWERHEKRPEQELRLLADGLLPI